MTSNPPSGCHLPDGSDCPSSHLAVVNREKRNGWDPLCWHTVVPQPICSSVLTSRSKRRWRGFPKTESSCPVHSLPSLSAVHIPHWLDYRSQPRLRFRELQYLSLSWVWLTYSDCENHDPLLILILIKKKNEFLGQYMSVQTKLPAIGIIITAEDCQFMKSLTLNILLMSFI